MFFVFGQRLRCSAGSSEQQDKPYAASENAANRQKQRQPLRGAFVYDKKNRVAHASVGERALNRAQNYQLLGKRFPATDGACRTEPHGVSINKQIAKMEKGAHNGPKRCTRHQAEARKHERSCRR